jgi:arylsulfatase A-like enzyme
MKPFYKIIIVLPAFCFCLTFCNRSTTDQEVEHQPNIVFILVENISTEWSCYGEPLVQTPNIDHLAQEGVLYNLAFTTSSVCAPSRAAMMTGAYQIKTNTQNLRMNRERKLPEPYRAITHYLRQAGYFTAIGCGYSFKTDINFSPREGKVFGFDGNDWSERPEGQPFFAQITLDITHRGDHWYTEEPSINPDAVILPPEIPDHEICRDDFARYLTQIQNMDLQVSKILKRLEEEGIEDKTVVILMGDNGRDLFRGMDYLYDAGIHVPLVIRWPGKLDPGTVNNELISSLDIIASILHIAGADIPEHFDGHSIFGSQAIKRNHIFAARDRVDEAVDRIRCVRTKRYKYIRNYMPEKGYYYKRWAVENNPTVNVVMALYDEGKLTPEQQLHLAKIKPLEELYDLETDPHEFNNVAEDPSYQTNLEEMRQLIDEWIEKTGDTGQYREKKEDVLETKWFNYDEVYGTD